MEIDTSLQIALSDTLGVELLKFLSIPVDNCSKATITIEANKEIMVHAEYTAFVKLKPGEEFDAKNALKNYTRQFHLSEVIDSD